MRFKFQNGGCYLLFLISSENQIWHLYLKTCGPPLRSLHEIPSCKEKEELGSFKLSMFVVEGVKGGRALLFD
jgi:hypothetical protein